MHAVGCSSEWIGTSSSNFKRLLDLAHRHELAAAAKEGVARLIETERQAQFAGDVLRAYHPAPAEIVDLFRRSDADILPHAERLQTVEVARRLAAEAIAGDIEQETGGRHLAAARDQRIDRITGRRREHEIGRRQRRSPILARFETLDRFR